MLKLCQNKPHLRYVRNLNSGLLLADMNIHSSLLNHFSISSFSYYFCQYFLIDTFILTKSKIDKNTTNLTKHTIEQEGNYDAESKKEC